MHRPNRHDHPAFASSYEDAALGRLRSLCQDLRRTIDVAAALLAAGRQVDLTGLDNGVGLACARALDLPPALAISAKTELIDVLEHADRLRAGLINSAAAELAGNHSAGRS